MSKSDDNFISFADSDAIVDVAVSDTRIVTPDDPLIINYTPADYDDVEIQGGQIYTQTTTTVNFTVLTKTS